MRKLKLPTIAFPKGKMEFPYCIDLIFAHLIAMRGVDYRRFYSECLKCELNKDGKTMAEVLRFPMFELGKYSAAGIVAQKVEIKELFRLVEFIRTRLKEKTPAVVHWDGYHCPWDKACFQKRHNDHLVMITGISRKGKRVAVCDPYFNKKKSVSIKYLFRASRFVWDIHFPTQFQFYVCDDPFKEIEILQAVLSDFVKLAESRPELLKPETDAAFMCELYRALQAGRVNLYFFGQYLSSENGGNNMLVLREKLAEAECLWVNCLLYLIRGSRSYYRPEEMLKRIRKICSALKLTTTAGERIHAETFRGTVNSYPICLRKYMNCKMFLSDDECAKSDFIEDEKLCVAPRTDTSKLTKEGRTFHLLISEEKDNIRFSGQTIDCTAECRGVSLLLVAEWIDADVAITFIFSDGSTAEVQVSVQDFPVSGANSVDLGEAYDLARWKAFSHVYARIADICWGGKKQLAAFRLSDNSHVHLLAAAAVL